MKYRMKTHVIEAEQWFAGQDPETYPDGVKWDDLQGCYTIPTRDGERRMKDGCFVVTGVDGGICLLEAEIFEQIYEPA